MDLEEITILSLSIWAVICLLLSNSFEIFITLLLIGTLIFYELGRNFMRKDVKRALQPLIYMMLLAFTIFVVKRAMEVLR